MCWLYHWCYFLSPLSLVFAHTLHTSCETALVWAAFFSFSFCSVPPSAAHRPLSAHLLHPVVSHQEPGLSSFMAPARSPRELRQWVLRQFLEMSLFWESRSCWEVFWLVHVSRLSAGFSSPWQQLCLRATMAPWLRRSVRICWERRTRMELTWSETARPSREPCVFVSSKYSAPRSQAPYTRLTFIKTSFF